MVRNMSHHSTIVSLKHRVVMIKTAVKSEIMPFAYESHQFFVTFRYEEPEATSYCC